MAKKKAAKGTQRRSSKGTRTKSSRGRSDDFKPDRDLSERWRQNRGGSDLREDNYSGTITGAKIGKRFNADAFILSVKLASPSDMKGQEVEIPFRLKSDVDLEIFGDVLSILGFNADEVDADQFSAVAREVGGSGEMVHFQATKSEGKKGGRIFTNYKLVRPRPE